MKKLLPKNTKNPQGFTLVELLVVISIIAILALIGLAIFSGLQARARNAKRASDIKAIANGFEVNKVPASASYPIAIDNTWYSGGIIATDPRASTQPYCVYTRITFGVITASVITASAWPALGACPLVGASGATGVTPVTVATAGAPITIVAAGSPPSAFMVCALLEPELGNAGGTICTHSGQ